MNNIRLRLLAIEKGDDSVVPPTHEEIKEALLERLGERTHTLIFQEEQKKTTRRSTTKPKGKAVKL